MGYLLLGFTAIFLLGAIITGVRFVPPEYRLKALLGWGLLASLFTVVGVGLLYLRKWAAIAFSILTTACALVVTRQAVQGMIHPAPGRADWLGFLFALILSVPAFITFKGWRSLVWRRGQI
jgi:hypothetical protein